MNIKKNIFLINEAIPYKKILLVSEDNSSAEMFLEDALLKAKEKKMDLILINKNAPVPVVKIMDYGKFLYEIKRKNKNGLKNTIKTKSITVKTKIDVHDLEWKSNKAINWFKSDNRVLFIIKAYGRVITRIDLIENIFERFKILVKDFGEPVAPLKKTNKIQFEAYFVPKKNN